MTKISEKVKLNHKIEYIVFFTFAVFIRAIPRSLAYWFARRFGSFAKLLLSGRRKIAIDNLSKAFPKLNRADVNQLCKASFQNMALGMVDMFRLDLYTEKLCNKLMDIEGEEFMKDMSSTPNGLIFLTGHLGFWEAGVFVFPRYGFKTNFVAKKIKNPLISHYIFEKRKIYNGDVIDKKNGLKKILKTFKNENAIGILLDQHAHDTESVAVDFFGRPVNVSVGIIQIASKKHIPIMPVFCYRIAKNRFKVVVHKPFYLDDDNSLISHASKINSLLEAAIKENPAQWMWIHKRWRGES